MGGLYSSCVNILRGFYPGIHYGKGVKGEAYPFLVLLGVLDEVVGGVDGIVCEPAGLLLLVMGRLGHHFGGAVWCMSAS